MVDLITALVRDARTFLWIAGVLALLLAIAAPVRTKWLDIAVSPLQRGALVIAAAVFFGLPLLVRPGPGRETASGSTEPREAPGGVIVSAPQIQFSVKPSNLDRQECVAAAEQGLRNAELTGVESNASVAWGYDDSYTGAVWCDAFEGRVVFLAAGPSAESGQRLLEAIRRGYPG